MDEPNELERRVYSNARINDSEQRMIEKQVAKAPPPDRAALRAQLIWKVLTVRNALPAENSEPYLAKTLSNETASWFRQWTGKEAKHVPILESKSQEEEGPTPGVILASVDPDQNRAISVRDAYKELRPDQCFLLQVYEEENRNGRRASDRLGIHPNTFRCRLRKIQQIFVRHGCAGEALWITSDDCKHRLGYPQALGKSPIPAAIVRSEPLARLLRLQMPFSLTQTDRFVRVPADLLNAILRFPFTRTQLRILLWVIRQTYGWNRAAAMFSWYGIAQDLSMDRGGIVRAGQALIRAEVLHAKKNRLSLHPNYLRSANRQDSGPSKSDDRNHRRITQRIGAPGHGKPMTGIIGSDDASHRFSDERKTGVKTIQKRRRGGGYVDNSRAAANDSVRELMNFYGALKGEALSSDEAARLSHSAKTLLEVCSGNLQEAKALLRQSFAKPET